MSPIFLFSFFFILALVLGFRGAPFWVWGIYALSLAGMLGTSGTVFAVLGIVIIVGSVPVIRRGLISRPLLLILKARRFFPKISDTERTAIEAGSVWVEGDLFSGKPDLHKLSEEPYPHLSAEECAFMEGPVNRLCEMIDDWKIWKERKIPDEVWTFIRAERFLGMVIPKEFGGLGFSPVGHSEVIRRIASRSIPVSVNVMVPNSLGPAELLIHYGTPEQKQRLLPRLASGEEIPCFALTEPAAGSDAAAIEAEGVLFRNSGGELMIRLNWRKRWITLAAISTLVGLAFRLRDPDNLFGRGEDLGITCALIPSHSPGIRLGARHDPLGVPFYNCPIEGEGVVISVEDIVGGFANAGKGWKMLMELLASGRGISFPAQCAGETQLVTRVVAAHALVRQQFGVSIGRFEGVQEPLAKIVGYNYIIESLRSYTISALDQGFKPGVATAISKYYSTELARRVATHAMDIMGGAGITLGPKNLIGHAYIAAPIAITVEGANILTRTLMIFGQGALRAHPYAFTEVKAVEEGDSVAFDRAFWAHIGHIIRNIFRSFLLSMSRGLLADVPGKKSVRHYYRRIAWASASFATLADIAMISFGGKLKIKGSITGRFADILGYLYIGAAVLRRYQADGVRREHLPLLHYSMGFIMGEIQLAFDGIFKNLRVPGLTWLLRWPLRFWSKVNSIGNGAGSDRTTHQIATMILENSDIRDLLTKDIFLPRRPNEQLFRLDSAVDIFMTADKVEVKLKNAVRTGRLPKLPLRELAAAGLWAGLITAEEDEAVQTWDRVRLEIIEVDSFSEDEYLSTVSSQVVALESPEMVRPLTTRIPSEPSRTECL